MFEDLRKNIYKIAEETIHCDLKCEGVSADINNGILPRGLYFEERNANKDGCAIIGMNPGKACVAEQQKYNAKTTYQEMDNLWNSRIKGFSYFRRAVKIVDNLGISGSIIWTDHVKCPSEKGTRDIPDQTYQACTDKFLTRELDLVPGNWPIIALSRDSFNRMSAIISNRLVIGIYHPAPAHNSGYFTKMAKQLKETNITCQDILKNAKQQNIWLPDYLN